MSLSPNTLVKNQEFMNSAKVSNFDRCCMESKSVKEMTANCFSFWRTKPQALWTIAPKMNIPVLVSSKSFQRGPPDRPVFNLDPLV